MTWESPPADAYTVLLDMPNSYDGTVKVADIRMYGRSIVNDLAKMWPMPWAETGRTMYNGVVTWMWIPEQAPDRETALERAQEWIRLHRENYLHLIEGE